MDTVWDELDPRLDPYLDEDNPARIGHIRHPVSAAALTPPTARPPGLSIVILTLDKPELIIPLVTDLVAQADAFAAKGLGYEVLIGDTGTTDPQVLAFYERQPTDVVRVVFGLKYQFSRCNNQVFFGEARYDTTLFLNNDVVIAENPGCLLTMTEHLRATPEIGIAGLCLYLGDRRVQHIGIEFFRDGPLHGFCYHPQAATTRPPATIAPITAVPAVTGACLMIRSDLFDRLGGFDEGYRTECQDVALCLAARRLGWRTDLVQAGWILHLENATRPKGSEDWADRRRFLRKWNAFIEATYPEPVVI